MEHPSLCVADILLLQYFSVAAEEQTLYRAAERLCLPQSFLTRHIKKLEEHLGFTVFIRHGGKLALTEDGARVRELIQPLLDLQENTLKELEALVKKREKVFALGFSTAFEQGVFSKVEARMRQVYGRRLRVVRGTSPRLARGVREGKLDAAFVALPLEAPGVIVMPLSYVDPLLLVLPKRWPEARNRIQQLREYSGRPLFWFRREDNPAFFDYAREVFAHAGYAPVYLDEPEERDALLDRIAAGEGMGLLPASFASARRKEVAFLPVKEGMLLRIRLGVLTVPGKTDVMEELAREFLEAAPGA